MADEIRVVSVNGLSMTFAFTRAGITPPTRNTDGAPFAPTPPTAFPAEVLALFSAAEQVEMSNGTRYVEVYRRDFLPNDSPGDVLREVRATYSKWLADRTAEYAVLSKFWQHVGSRFSAS